jgi:hypothetical protein
MYCFDIGPIGVTKFGERNFDPSFGPTKILDFTPLEFSTRVSSMLDSGPSIPVIDGYADFCKLIPLPNFTAARTGSLPITIENYQYLRSGYSARTEKELPVLSRWFELPLGKPKAEYLMIVVYNWEQLKAEHEVDNVFDVPFEFDYKWGIVAILGQMHPNEEPMKPITMLRNSLGKEEGGSGVPIDRERYDKSVEFWKINATVK